MESKGRLVSITRDFETSKLLVTFRLETEPIWELNELIRQQDEINKKTKKPWGLTIKAERNREKRSIDANRYFHLLMRKLADKLDMSEARCKNWLICSHGQVDYIEDGVPVVIKTNIGVDQMAEQELLHCKACRVERNEDGSEAIFYKVYRGSHTYDSREMAKLIEGTVQEAKEQGIETIPPDELARLVKEWKPKKE